MACGWLECPVRAECASQGLPRAVRGTKAGGSTRGAHSRHKGWPQLRSPFAAQRKTQPKPSFNCPARSTAALCEADAHKVAMISPTKPRIAKEMLPLGATSAVDILLIPCMVREPIP